MEEQDEILELVVEVVVQGELEGLVVVQGELEEVVEEEQALVLDELVLEKQEQGAMELGQLALAQDEQEEDLEAQAQK